MAELSPVCSAFLLQVKILIIINKNYQNLKKTHNFRQDLTDEHNFTSILERVGNIPLSAMHTFDLNYNNLNKYPLVPCTKSLG